MARFEMTISDGEKIIIDHPTDEMQDLLLQLQSSEFLLLNEIRGTSVGGGQEVIIASRQVTLVRTISSDSRQSTTFRPKR